ncbi:MAG: FAD-dependent oxidoreductase [Acidimicrobiales bacterium]
MPDAAGDTPTAEAAPRPPIPDDGVVHDVLVVGGGPSGSACAYWLADAGWDVVVVEKKHFPRDKTCGDGLTPRSVRQLADMGLEGALTGAHRFDGLRSCAYGMSMDLRWPDHPSFPSHGYVITRHDLDQIVSERAVKAGAVVWEGAEAVTPLLADTWIPADTSLPADAPVAAPGAAARSGAGSAGSGPATGSGGLPACVGAVVRDLDHGGTVELRARYVVVCD